MTAIKIDSKPSNYAGNALALHGPALFARLGSSRLAVVELRSVERGEAAPDEEKEPSVKVRVVQAEVANEQQEDTLRQVLNALNLHRTAYGTLTEDGDIRLSDSILERCVGEGNVIEAVRLKAALDHWAEYGARLLSQPKLTLTGLRHELETMVQGMTAATAAARD